MSASVAKICMRDAVDTRSDDRTRFAEGSSKSVHRTLQVAGSTGDIAVCRQIASMIHLYGRW
jgi:hypothetical protein